MTIIADEDFNKDMVILISKLSHWDIKMILRKLGKEPEDIEAFMNTLKIKEEEILEC